MREVWLANDRDGLWQLPLDPFWWSQHEVHNLPLDDDAVICTDAIGSILILGEIGSKWDLIIVGMELLAIEVKVDQEIVKLQEW